MSLSIRLSRGGAKKRPFYRIVVADSRAPRDGRFIEKLGTYNPMLNNEDQNRVTLKQERIQYWLGVGAKPSSRVHRFLANAGIIEALPIPKQTKKDQPKAKAQELIREREEKAKKESEGEQAATEEVSGNDASDNQEPSAAEEEAKDDKQKEDDSDKEENSEAEK